MDASSQFATDTWNLDIPCEAVPNAGTHQRLWPAATSFCRWLQETGCTELGWHAVQRPELQPPCPLRLLELGSGLGWLAMAILKNLPDVVVTLTDMPGRPTSDLKAVIEKAVALHFLSNMPEVHALDWSDFLEEAGKQSIEAKGFSADGANIIKQLCPALRAAFSCHTVFGTDLCWDSRTTKCLASMLSFFAKVSLRDGGGPRVIYAHWNRSSRILSLLLDQLKELDTSIKVLHPRHYCGCLDKFLHQGSVQCSSTCLVHSSSDSNDVKCPSTTSHTSGDKAEAFRPSKIACPDELGVDDWETFISQSLFEDAADSFPEPIFFVFEILARPCSDVVGGSLA